MKKEVHILMLEDNLTDAELNERELRKAGLECIVRCVTSRDDFVRELETFAPDLILAGSKLPAFDGLSALALTREKFFDLPFIFVTGSLGEERAINTLLRGATDYVLKERLSRLAPAVQRALAEAEERTKRREMENKFINAAREWRCTFDAINDLIALLDREGKILRCNRAMASFLRRSFKDIIGKSFYEFIYGAEAPVNGNNPLVRVLKSAEREALTAQLSGRWYHVTVDPVIEDSGVVTGVAYIMIDVTDRKQAEDALRNSEARYKRLIESVTNYIFTVRVENGRPIETTHGEGCLALTGYTADEYKADPYLWHRMIFDEDRKAVTEQADKVLAGEVTEPIEHRIIHKDGSIRWVRNTSVPRFDDHGRLVAYDGLIADITEHKKLQEAEVARFSAEAASKAKSNFLANMSHELRTPLNSVLGFARVLQKSMFGPLNAKQQEYVGYIEESGEHLLKLINDILDLSKVEAGRMELEPVLLKLAPLVQGTVNMLRGKALKHNIRLTITVAAEADIEIKADERKLKQILFNLLSNALKFTPNGGGVSITAKRCRTQHPGSRLKESEDMNQASCIVHSEGDCIEISVADTGIGIKPEDMCRLFKEFSQIDTTLSRAYEGTGLGLALTKKLVELHGGRIWAESEYGKGSRFTFIIPLKPVRQQPESLPLEKVPGKGAVKGRILQWDEFRERALQCLLAQKNSGKIFAVLQCDCGGEDADMAQGILLSRHVRRDDFIGQGNRIGRYVIVLAHADRKSAETAAMRFKEAMQESPSDVAITVIMGDEPDQIEECIAGS